MTIHLMAYVTTYHLLILPCSPPSRISSLGLMRLYIWHQIQEHSTTVLSLALALHTILRSYALVSTKHTHKHIKHYERGYLLGKKQEGSFRSSNHQLGR